MKRALVLLLIVSPAATAGEVHVHKDSATGWDVYTLTQGDTEVKVVPAAGANAYSMVHAGAEYFRVPEQMKDLPGVGHGNPILYPMPNRVKGAQFTFEGKTYAFPKNGRGNFIHGLVHSESFEVDSYTTEGDSAQITCSLHFKPGTRPYELFPWDHVFRVTILVRDGVVRWDYQVDNHKSGRNLPFGVAYHPYIIYQQAREDAYLTVPAKSLMESEQQLPSGKLLELEGHRLDAREPVSLQGFQSDDVFFGMTPGRPAKIEFRAVGRSIEFYASEEFTHLVVWTPDRPYLGIENQTCSTDAHNLAARDMNDVAHLQICPPGEKREGRVEYRLK